MKNEKLPKNWIETTLGDIALWGSGGTPSRAVPSYYNGGIPWVKTGDLNDSILNDVEESISQEGLKNSSAKIFPKGSVVLAMYGATIGKTAILGIDAATNQACAVAQAYEGVYNKYLFYYLRSQKRSFINKGKGGAQPNISQAVIKSHPFPLAPSQEQYRIANKIDIILNLIGSLSGKLEKTNSRITALKQKVLVYAISGKLTEEWRIKKHISTQVVIKKVKDISTKIQYGYTESASREIIGPKFLRITDIQEGKVEWSTVPYCKIQESEKEKYLLNKHDLLFARTGATVGKSFLIENDIPEAVFASYLIRIVLKKNCNPKYIWYFFNSQSYWNQIHKNAKGIGQPNVNGTVLSEIELPLPSVDEQDEIVHQVEALFKVIDSLLEKCRRLENKIQDLPESFLSNAFNGALVQQNGSDEPAIKLSNIIRSFKHVDSEKMVKQKEKSLKPEQTTSSKMSLEEEIRTNFKRNLFSFEDLKSKVPHIKYNELKNKFFRLLDEKKIEASFNEKAEGQFFKIIK